MPSPRRALLVLPAAAAALALAGCSLGDDGPRTSQTRDVPHFTRVHNEAPIDVRLHVGEPQRVRVRAGEKVIDDVRTEVRDGTLELTFDHSGLLGDDVVADVSVPKLTGIETSGSGDIDADGITADAFDIRSDGSADIALAGTVEHLGLDIHGSGDADLTDLRAREAQVSVAGSGDADINAARALDVRVDGSGDVRYLGHPRLSQSVDGSGDVSRAG
jgi:putative autotransporter adhesin-like protein